MTTENNNIPKRENDYEQETLNNERLLSEHEYDGIRELDNDMPFWLKWLFILSIAFAFIYLIRLWVFRSDDLYQLKEYQAEVAAANTNPAAAARSEAFELVLLQDEGSLAQGKEIWTKTCAVCHLADGGGLVGPNMTDNYWLHGNTLEDIYGVIENGVIDKGMLSYKDQYSPKQRLEVASYILVKLHGSTPAKAKEPQGELYE